MGSSSVGLTIFTTSKILVAPSLFTAEIVTVSGANVTGSVVGTSSLTEEDGFCEDIWNLVNGMRAKLDTPGSFLKGLSIPICSKILEVVLNSVKFQKLILARKIQFKIEPYL